MTRFELFAGVIAAVTLSACAHTIDHDISHLASQDQCEAAAMLTERHQGIPTTSRIKQAVVVPASLAAAGLGYTADVTLTVGGTGAVSILLCSPLVLLGAAVGNVDGGAECIVDVWGALLSGVDMPGLGAGAYEKTRRWRCADTSWLTRRWRRVAQCYQSRGDTRSLAHAAQTLDYVHERPRLTKCLSDREQRLLDEQSLDLAVLASTPPLP